MDSSPFGPSPVPQFALNFTSWAAVIAVPTAVTGFYGQNVPYPGFGTEWGFIFSTLITIVLSVSRYALFRRKDWL